MIVTVYFEKKRAFALGIAEVGGALGTVIMAPLLNFLDSNFGWGCTFKMMGALLLVCVPLGLLLKPISDKNSKSERPMASSSGDFDRNKDEENLDSGFCASFVFQRPQIPKFPKILYAPVVAICFLANFVANIGYPVAFSYTVVSMCSLFFILLHELLETLS